PHPLVAPADIERIVEALEVVGPDVENDWQRRRRMEPATAGVEPQFADRDAHAPGALVAQAKDALAVGHDDSFDLVEPRMRQNLLDAILVRQAQKKPARLPEQPAELLAAEADCRRVHDRQQLLEILNEQGEEQRFVAVLQITQERIALEVGLEAAQNLQAARRLLLERSDARRQKAMQVEGVTLRLGKRCPLVEQWVGQQLMSGLGDFEKF